MKLYWAMNAEIIELFQKLAYVFLFQQDVVSNKKTILLDYELETRNFIKFDWLSRTLATKLPESSMIETNVL